MKYILTKNSNIWEVLKEDSISFIVNDKHTPPPFDICVVLKTEVIKQADTIYELCDYAVVKLRFTNLPDVMNLEEMNKKGKLHNPPAKYIDNLKFLITDKRAEYIIFAIWTGERFVNVAEMNDEGEIELL